MGRKRSIHVVGTGTIGEPLIGLLLHTRQALAVDEVTFYKHSPRHTDRAKIGALIRRGAKLAVAPEKMVEFEKLGVQPTYLAEEALEQAAVVIDCTSDGLGNAHKQAWYTKLPASQGFIAQGSEFGFGKMYARSINDSALVPGVDRFLQVVSCNTHNLAAIVATLGLHEEAPDNLLEGRFLCLRRASDISQTDSFSPAQKPRPIRIPGSAPITPETPGICLARWIATSICFPRPSNSIRNTCIACGSICGSNGP